MEYLLGDVIPTDRLERMISNEPRPATARRPWVMANMVTTLDGTVALDGTSGALGNAGDREIFRILRACADVIVAGASTARAERYRTPSAPAGTLGTLRAERGQATRPQLCIVTKSMQLEPVPPALGAPDDDTPTLIGTTHARAAAAHQSGAPSRWAGPTTYVAAGDDEVDPPTLLRRLRERGAGVILVEGGPTLLAQFAAADAIDEWNLTVSPTLSGGTPRLIPDALPSPRSLELVRVCRSESHLFLRYLDRGTTQSTDD